MHIGMASTTNLSATLLIFLIMYSSTFSTAYGTCKPAPETPTPSTQAPTPSAPEPTSALTPSIPAPTPELEPSTPALAPSTPVPTPEVEPPTPALPPSAPVPTPPKPAPTPTAPTPGKETCPRDTLKLGVCANLLGFVNVRIGSPASSPCCALLQGLVDSEAALCLCTAIKANILGINLNVPFSLSVLLSACQKNVPPGFKCE